MKKVLSILLISIICLTFVGCQKEKSNEEYISLVSEQLDKKEDLDKFNDEYIDLINETIFGDQIIWEKTVNIGRFSSDTINNLTKNYNELEKKTEEIDINLLNEYIDYCKENSNSPALAISILKDYYDILDKMTTYKLVINTINKSNFDMDDLILIRKYMKNISD